MDRIFFLIVSFTIQMVLLNQANKIEELIHFEKDLGVLKKSVKFYFYFLCVLTLVNIGYFTSEISMILLNVVNWTLNSIISGAFTIGFSTFTFKYYNLIREISKNEIQQKIELYNKVYQGDTE
jgi:hypothetical protein